MNKIPGLWLLLINMFILVGCAQNPEMERKKVWKNWLNEFNHTMNIYIRTYLDNNDNDPIKNKKLCEISSNYSSLIVKTAQFYNTLSQEDKDEFNKQYSRILKRIQVIKKKEE